MKWFNIKVRAKSRFFKTYHWVYMYVGANKLFVIRNCNTPNQQKVTFDAPSISKAEIILRRIARRYIDVEKYDYKLVEVI